MPSRGAVQAWKVIFGRVREGTDKPGRSSHAVLPALVVQYAGLGAGRDGPERGHLGEYPSHEVTNWQRS